MKAEVIQQRSLLELAELDAERGRIEHRAGHLAESQRLETIQAAHREANDRLQYAEGEADKVMLGLLKDLYHGPYDAKELVILQELYEMVEQAVDRCRNAGNIVVQIVLKHS